MQKDTTPKPSIRSVFQNRTYTRLFLAQITSQIGTMIGMTAFAFYLLDKFASQPGYATVTEMMYSLPTLAVFFLVGVLADRMDRQKIASNANLIAALLTVALLAAIQIGWMPLIFAILFLRTACARFFHPAQTALVRGVLSREHLTTAVGLNQMVMSTFILLGNGLGALSYWNFGVEGAILIDLISFLVSSYLIRTANISEDVRLPNGRTHWKDLNLRVVAQDFKLGSLYILRFRLLLTLMLGLVILGVCNGAMTVLPMFFYKYKLASETYEAWMVTHSAAFAIGILVGSPIATWLAQRVKNYHLMNSAFLLAGVALFYTAVTTSPYVFVAMIFLYGLSVPLVNVPWFGWINRIVDPKMMGRVTGWHTPLMMSSQATTLWLIALLYPGGITLETMMWIVAGSQVLIAAYYWFYLPALARKQLAEEAKLEPVAAG